MRILYLANNYVGWQVLQWLTGQGENIVGLVLHPATKRKYGDEMLQVLNLPPECVLDGSQLRDEQVMAAVAALEPEVGVSVYFSYILKHDFLKLFPRGAINLHPSLLPYNRGAYPNVWSIVDGTPAGATLHMIDAGIDTGAILGQARVPVEPTDTGETLFRKLESASIAVFQDTWQAFKNGELTPLPQAADQGSSHRINDVGQIDRIDLDRSYTARDLINILRARTFPPYRGAYFEVDGQRVYLRLSLEREEGEPDVSDQRT